MSSGQFSQASQPSVKIYSHSADEKFKSPQGGHGRAARGTRTPVEALSTCAHGPRDKVGRTEGRKEEEMQPAVVESQEVKIVCPFPWGRDSPAFTVGQHHSLQP